MAEIGFKNFGDLYRAAYAEPDEKKKILLLSQVKQVLDAWAQASGTRAGSPTSENVVTPYN